MTLPSTPILMCVLLGIVAIGLYVLFLGAKYGWGELRAPEAWAVALLLGIGFFFLAMLHPAWMPPDMWRDCRHGERGQGCP